MLCKFDEMRRCSMNSIPAKSENSKAFGGLITGAFAVAVLATAIGTFSFSTRGLAETAVLVPPPTVMEPQSSVNQLETAIVAGGCFWGVQAVFQHIKGVKGAVSGYAGGVAETAQYEMVSSGTTGHAEAVQITFDPKVINYGTILQVYFSVAHNPTELNRQGPDTGTQYRSAVFPESDAQKQVAEAYIKQLGESGVFKEPVVTSIETAKAFYPAEAYHQDYATLNPDSNYIAMFDLPKIEALNRLFPELYNPKPVLVGSAMSPS